MVQRGVRVQLDPSLQVTHGVHADVTLHYADGRSDATLNDVPVVTEVFAAGEVYTGVVALRSVARDAERRFQRIVVALDSVPGNQVEGVSPLYHVINIDTADGMSAVVRLSCRIGAEELQGLLSTLSDGQEGAVSLCLVDMRDSGGTSVAIGGNTETGPGAGLDVAHDAAVLAPWLDMDPEAKLGRDQVSYLLAFAPNADTVGLLSEQWILGDTR